MSAEERKSQWFDDDRAQVDEALRQIAQRLAPNTNECRPTPRPSEHLSSRHRAKTSVWTFLPLFILAATPSILLLLAMLNGVLQTGGIPDPPRAVASLSAWWTTGDPSSTRQKSSLNPAQVELDIANVITAEPRQQTSLGMRINSAELLPANSRVTIYGLPEGTTLSAGQPLSETVWTSYLSEATDLRATVPSTAAGDHRMSVELSTPSGVVVARHATQLVVADHRDRGLVQRHESVERIESLIAHGQKMIAVGYLAGARAYFRRAAEAGSGKAALALSATYDEQFISEIGSRGIKPDRAQAQAWYARAEELGLPGADASLAGLTRQDAIKAAASPDVFQATSSLQSSVGSEASESQGWVEPLTAINMRDLPSPGGRVLRVVRKGTRLRIRTGKEGWLQVVDPKTRDEGWVLAKSFDTSQVSVTSENRNPRSADEDVNEQSEASNE